MLKYVFVFFSVLQIVSCRPKDSESAESAPLASATGSDSIADSFFPVTNYLKGQVNDIRLKAVNPIIYITKNNVLDSAWLKTENLEKEMSPFFESLIDTANLKELFSEKKFLDQTLNAFTFTYDPKASLPDSLSLQHWDVYVDPNTNKVKRIYIIRKVADKQQQLTWQSDKWCKIVTIGTDKNNTNYVEKEVLIKWDF